MTQFTVMVFIKQNIYELSYRSIWKPENKLQESLQIVWNNEKHQFTKSIVNPART